MIQGTLFIGNQTIIQYTSAMNILIITNLYPPYVLGGYEILCGQVVHSLLQHGHRITILTSVHGTADGVPVQDIIEGCMVTRSLRLFCPFERSAGSEIGPRISTERYNRHTTTSFIEQLPLPPDIIFMWSQLRLTPGPARAAEASGIPIVYTFNDENIAGYLPAPFRLTPKGVLRYLFDRLIAPAITLRGIRFEHTTCISRILKRNLITRGLWIEDSHVIYQGIPIERFPLRPDAGKRQEPIRVLYAGQLHAYKGVHTILEAAALLSKNPRTPSFTLTITGKGPDEYTSRLQKEAEGLTVPITFTGIVPHDQMPELYRSHDVFIFPSIWEEPFGLTHLEAMASGLPVISTVNGGQGEFLVEGVNALVFPPEDADKLARELDRLLADDALYERLVREGRMTAESSFTFTRYVQELEAFMEQVVKEYAP